jgi:hypothetical protein
MQQSRNCHKNDSFVGWGVTKLAEMNLNYGNSLNVS